MPPMPRGGREWMTAQLAAIVRSWRSDLRFDLCGIGFGGPVDFLSQRVVPLHPRRRLARTSDLVRICS